MIENIGFYGQWTIESENIKTGIKTKQVFKNAIVQGFFTAIHRFLSQDQLIVTNNELNLTHLGIGDNNTSAMRTDTILYNEVERVDYASKTFTDSLYTVKIYLDSGQGNMVGGYIKELGLFANATATLNSGTMLSRSVVDVQKNENIRLSLTWELRGV